MKRVTHFDRLGLRLDAGSVEQAPGGGVYVSGIAARTGLYTYHDDKGEPFVELVPASTLFDQASMDSLVGKPFTIRHPDGLVTPEAFQEVTHGSVAKVWQASDSELGVKVYIGSRGGLDALEDGMVELSPGYEVDLSGEPGTSEFGRHDAVQDKREYDHLSGLWRGEARGGPAMRLHVDGEQACAPAGCRLQWRRHARLDGASSSKRETMKVKLTHSDGRAVEMDAAVAQALRFVALDAAAIKKAQADELALTELTIREMPDGEPQTMTIPSAMVEQMMAPLGVMADPMAAPAAEPPGMEEVEQVEATDAGDENEDRRDSNLAGLIAREVTKQLSQRDAAASLRHRVTTDAAEIIGAPQEGKTWQVAFDAIVKADPGKSSTWRRHKDAAERGDRLAQGRLLGELERLATERRDSKINLEPAPKPAPNHDGGARSQPWTHHDGAKR